MWWFFLALSGSLGHVVISQWIWDGYILTWNLNKSQRKRYVNFIVYNCRQERLLLVGHADDSVFTFEEYIYDLRIENLFWKIKFNMSRSRQMIIPIHIFVCSAYLFLQQSDCKNPTDAKCVPNMMMGVLWNVDCVMYACITWVCCEHIPWIGICTFKWMFIPWNGICTMKWLFIPWIGNCKCA